MKNIKNGAVSVGDTDMYYISCGRGPKSLVVLPGLSDGIATVKGKAMILSVPYKKFEEEFTVYMFSRKNKMPEGYSIEDMAEDQVKAMLSLGIKKACVMGVSQGGMIAQYIAINHPEVVEKLILAVTAPYANDTVKNAVNGWIDMTKRDDYTELMTDTARKMYSDGYLKKNEKFFPLIAKFTKPKTYERFLINANAILHFDARAKLSQISAPTLIMAGDNDKTVGNDAPGEFSTAIADNEVSIYKGYGHGLHDESGEFYDRVYSFCTDKKQGSDLDV